MKLNRRSLLAGIGLGSVAVGSKLFIGDANAAITPASTLEPYLNSRALAASRNIVKGRHATYEHPYARNGMTSSPTFLSLVVFNDGHARGQVPEKALSVWASMLNTVVDHGWFASMAPFAAIQLADAVSCPQHAYLFNKPEDRRPRICLWSAVFFKVTGLEVSDIFNSIEYPLNFNARFGSHIAQDEGMIAPGFQEPEETTWKCKHVYAGDPLGRCQNCRLAPQGPEQISIDEWRYRIHGALAGGRQS